MVLCKDKAEACWVILSLDRKAIFRSRSVICNETSFPFKLAMRLPQQLAFPDSVTKPTLTDIQQSASTSSFEENPLDNLEHQASVPTKNATTSVPGPTNASSGNDQPRKLFHPSLPPVQETITEDTFPSINQNAHKYKAGQIVDVGHKEGPFYIKECLEEPDESNTPAYVTYWPNAKSKIKDWQVSEAHIDLWAKDAGHSPTITNDDANTTKSGTSALRLASILASHWASVTLYGGTLLPSCHFVSSDFEHQDSHAGAYAVCHLASACSHMAETPKVGVTLVDDINLPRFSFQKYGKDYCHLAPLINEAEQIEMQTLYNIGAFSEFIKELPDDADGKVDKLLWVYRAKPDAEGKLSKVKARLTLRGDLQRTHFMGKDASAPVMEWSTFRLIVAMHARDPEVKWAQYDIVAAYLTAKMRRPVYVQLPREHTPPEFWGWFTRVNMALYGGLDSGRCFYDKMSVSTSNWVLPSHRCTTSAISLSSRMTALAGSSSSSTWTIVWPPTRAQPSGRIISKS